VRGYIGLYQGLTGALIKEGPPSALYLGVYEAGKSTLLAMPAFAQTPLIVYLISGALGECVGSVVRAPAEAIKSRVQSGLDSSTADSFKSVVGNPEGRANIVRAWSASLWRDVPFGGIQLAIFESLKSYIIASPATANFDVNSLMAEVLLGATGGAIGSLVTVPMDVITIRIITQQTTKPDECDALAPDDVPAEACDVPLGFIDMAKQVYSEGGVPALFTGWRARTGYWAPAIGIFLSCYCSLRQAALTVDLPGLPMGLP